MMSVISRQIAKHFIIGVTLTIILLSTASCGGRTSNIADTNSNDQGSTTTITNSSTATTSAVLNTSTTLKNSTTAPNAQDIAAKTLKAAENLKTLKFTMDFSMTLDFPTSQSVRTMKMQQNATGSINVPNKEMALDIDMTMDMSGQGNQSISAELYSRDGWMYMKSILPGGKTQWNKMKLTDELWNQQSKLSGMTDLLKSPINLDLVASEKINGIDCFVLNITPNASSISNWMSGNLQTGQTTNPGINSTSDFGNIVVKEWIAKDTYLLVKQQISLKMNSSQTTTGTSGTGGMIMDATLTYFDYGKPVTIQLPSEALTAPEITLPTTSK
jgi:hypothetical protein